MYEAFVVVDFGNAPQDEDNWPQINEHVHAAAEGIPDLKWLGGRTACGCRTFRFECPERQSAEQLKWRLGNAMSAQLDAQEVVLPLRRSIVEGDLVDLFAAVPAPDSVRISWNQVGFYKRRDDHFEYGVLVKVSTNMARAAVARSLRQLADEMCAPTFWAGEGEDE